ncbi:MAG: hypothetical protein KAY70_01435 [Acetobacterium sp.]|nr:hypothetical protein [Acetobacterium sp.]
MVLDSDQDYEHAPPAKTEITPAGAANAKAGRFHHKRWNQPAFLRSSA